MDVICDMTSRFNGRTWDSVVRELEHEVDDLRREMQELRGLIDAVSG